MTTKAVEELQKLITFASTDGWPGEEVVRACAAVCEDDSLCGQHYARLILSVLDPPKEQA